MSSAELDERSKAILLEIVQDYIQFGEPVGSRTVSKNIRKSLSPASIRNIMADLSETGFIQQAHKSAGRTPTNKGYKFFVNHLMNNGKLHHLPKEIGSGAIQINQHSLQGTLESACSDLSQSSMQTGLVMYPSFSNTLFKHIEFVKVGMREALAVFYSDLGIMQNKIIPIEQQMTQEELVSISNYINKEFSGQSIKSIRKEAERRIRNEKEHYDRLKKKALELSAKFLDDPLKSELLVEGAFHLLDSPEIGRNIERMRGLLKMVEEKTKLIRLLDHCLEHDGSMVFIGSEDLDEDLEDCSLIAENYGCFGENLGTVAIFGPRRMDYSKMIPIVKQTAHAVSRNLSTLKKEVSIYE